MTLVTGADRQKAKFAMLFSALGLVGFLLNLFAGFGLWAYSDSRSAPPPTYDRFVGELRSTDAPAMPALATEMFENWSACETTRGGMTEVAIHAMITSSVVAIALFFLSLVMSAQLYARLGRAIGSEAPPQPPEPVDETWKS
jgi:hypothetical protein